MSGAGFERGLRQRDLAPVMQRQVSALIGRGDERTPANGSPWLVFERAAEEVDRSGIDFAYHTAFIEHHHAPGQGFQQRRQSFGELLGTSGFGGPQLIRLAQLGVQLNHARLQAVIG